MGKLAGVAEVCSVSSLICGFAEIESSQLHAVICAMNAAVRPWLARRSARTR